MIHMPEATAWAGTTPARVTPPPALGPGPVLIPAHPPARSEKQSGDAARAAPPKPKTLDLGHGVNLELVLVPAGRFSMGSPETEEERFDNEPQHAVTITKPFYMGKFPVTQQQYEQIMGKNTSRFKGKDNPAETVSWDDAQEFCKRLSRTAKQTVRLPTEAEWEYACRAGTRTRYYCGDSEEDLKRAAWFQGNSKVIPVDWPNFGCTTHPVGQKEANAFGLYDMLGNVWQWCRDGYDDYQTGAATDPQGPARSKWRVLRGGSAFDFPGDCRSACRGRCGLGYSQYFLGFRVVVEGTSEQN